MSKNIYLLGMPSSGKSTLGKQIAKILKYDFIDLDARITASEAKTITEIFSLNGEAHFRKIESEQLKKIAPNSSVVVASGGGTPCYFDNIDFIKANGVSVFLDVPPNKLYERMQNSKKGERPLFNQEGEDLKASLTDKYNSRLPFYKKADLLIEGDTDAEGILWILEYQGDIKR